MRKFAMLVGVSALALGVSASPSHAADQNVRVFTYPEVNAHCTLENENGEWMVEHTPEYISIDRAHGPLTVTCKSPTGLWSGRIVTGAGSDSAVLATAPVNAAEVLAAMTNLPPDTDAAAFALAAAVKYPGNIVVPMVKSHEALSVATPVEPQDIAPMPAPGGRFVRHHRPVHHRVVHHVRRPVC